MKSEENSDADLETKEELADRMDSEWNNLTSEEQLIFKRMRASEQETKK